MNIFSTVLFSSLALLTSFSSPAFSSPPDSVKRVFFYSDSSSVIPDSGAAFLNGVKIADAKVSRIVPAENCAWGTKAVKIRETNYENGKKENFIVIAGIGKFALFQASSDNKKIFFKKWPDKKIDEFDSTNTAVCTY